MALDKTRPPNVVLFISDQQRADTMPGVRTADVHTPHLAWLAERGTLFRRAYCTTPMCTPARASILSGLYPHTNGMVANHQERPISNQMRLSPNVRVLADFMKPHGYRCAYAGKWHLGTGGDRRGFSDFTVCAADYDVDGPEQNETLTFTRKIGVSIGGKQHGFDPDRNVFDRRRMLGPSLLPLAFHPSARDALHAGRYIREMASGSRPFLLVYSCHEPHPPFVSPRPFDRMYAPAAMPLPETRRDPGGGRLMRGRVDWQLQPAAPYSDGDLQAMWAAYYGAVSYVDHLVGILLEALVDADQLDHTLFVFMSDHGEMLGSHGMVKKGAVLFEELVNVPLLIYPPGGLSASHQTDRLVSHVDVLPTMLGWCGIPVPEVLQGVDIRALAEGGDAPVRPGLALEYHSSNWGERPCPLRGWRTEGWKYVEGVGGGEELYDLQNDPLEIRNLIGAPEAAGAQARMKAELYDWMKRTGDPWPEVPVSDLEVDRPLERKWDTPASG